MSPKIAGVEVPPLKLVQLNERQLQAMSPFERAVWKRLDDNVEVTAGLHGAVEQLSKDLKAHQLETKDRDRAHQKSANRRTWLQATVTPAVVIAIVGAILNYASEKVKADAIAQANHQATAAVASAIPTVEQRAEIKAAELAKAIVDEQERRERQQPIRRDPDLVTPRQTAGSSHPGR